ncbi:acyl-CoA thioesterase [Carboxylicivirga sp. N1Y90]|uniref:acyl-CoA thioesterase n=1 Tax=Carboxylicivirga fragile TaxID=3417571 RepID=UPI003D336F2A|nr:acyl-CoA thioesterase [Marinilabiliaceae bacterium N1Y90]
MEEKIKNSETRQFKAVFPTTYNANETLFGGLALKWMDEVAYITATRFTRQRMFTIKTGEIKFHKAVGENTIVEVVGKISKVQAVTIDVAVDIYCEPMYDTGREKVISGVFTFASLNDKNKPQRIKIS